MSSPESPSAPGAPGLFARQAQRSASNAHPATNTRVTRTIANDRNVSTVILRTSRQTSICVRCGHLDREETSGAPPARRPDNAVESRVLLARAGRKPGSVPALPPAMVIPLGRPLPDGSCDQLEIESARATPAGHPAISDRSCSRWGLPCPPRHRGGGALLPRRFTLTGPCEPAVYFLLHCPSSHPDWPLASTLPCGARTFLDGRPKGPPRPPHRLEREARGLYQAQPERGLEAAWPALSSFIRSSQ